jgi:predicted DNA-binding antitoxin AbrB/MazE fold protein
MNKLYYKDGKLHPLKDIKIVEGEKAYVYPSKKMLIAHGYTPYEETLDGIKEKLINEVLSYDKSDSVECVYIKGEKTWFNKQERASLMNLATCYKSKKEDGCVLWVNSKPYEYTCDALINVLAQLEIYASECFNATQLNVNAIKALLTVEEVKSYNYKSKYPVPLNF